jgi:beta-glucosidase
MKKTSSTAPYKDSSLPPEKRAADLLGRMTVEEKVGQLRSFLFMGEYPGAYNPWHGVGFFNLMNTTERIQFILSIDYARIVKAGYGHFSVTLRDLDPKNAARLANRIQRIALEETRLGIPVMIHDEGLHGLCANGATSFPQSIALSATWDPALLKEISTIIGIEARSRGIRQLLSPTINIARDARAGRTEETYGEDPFLTARLAVAYVSGLQSESVVATPKHFAANFVGDGGRDSHPIHFSEQLLREVYFPAFEAAVREGGALSIMAAYNSINGLPCSADPWLLTEVLKKEWGFKGYVVSDYFSVEHIFTKHAAAASFAEAGQRALEAGLDVEFPYISGFGDGFLEGLKAGQISMAALDEAVRRVLETKLRIGLFDNPYVDEGDVEKLNHAEVSREVALRAARESIVLLKNKAGTLPLAKGVGSLAVIGPLADRVSLGGYAWDRLPREQVLTPLDGLRAAAVKIQVRYAEGCTLTRAIPNGIETAAVMARSSDVAVVFVGNGPETEGEGRDRSDLALPGAQADLVKAVAATGTPTVVVLISGSPVIMRDWLESVAAVVEAWYPGEMGGLAIAEVLFGEVNPSGKLTISFPRKIGQLPLYYNAKPSGRDQGYMDESGTALFPFGYGLSYTRFEYGGMEITPAEGQQFTIQFELANSGPMEGDEVAQLYVHDVISTYTRPVKELKAFTRVHLEAGESKKVVFNLEAGQLGYYGRDGKYRVEPGAFDVWIGSSSEDIRLGGKIVVK